MSGASLSHDADVVAPAGIIIMIAIVLASQTGSARPSRGQGDKTAGLEPRGEGTGMHVVIIVEPVQ
jgi:hypothetical protein